MNPDAELHWRDWGADYVLFNAGSGQTHFLNVLGFEALTLLKVQPVTEEVLLQILSERFQLDDHDPAMQSHLRAMMESMDSLGLIEPCLS